MLVCHAVATGIGHLHAHRLRNYFPHIWLTVSGHEQALMILAGCRSRQMLGRYARSMAEPRSKDAHRKARLGDQL